jgi:hypothetical protein
MPQGLFQWKDCFQTADSKEWKIIMAFFSLRSMKGRSPDEYSSPSPFIPVTAQSPCEEMLFGGKIIMGTRGVSRPRIQ